MCPVNHTVTSREQLLAAAGEIAAGRGLAGLSIRALAARCGVAVGSIYNYFPTKADLVAALVEDFWRRTAHRTASTPLPGEAFPDYVGRLYGDLRASVEQFRAGWAAQLSALEPEALEQGRALERRCFVQMKRGLSSALEQSGAPAWGGPAAEAGPFVDFVFRNLLALLREGEPDCAYFQRVLGALTLEKEREA